MTDPDSAWGRSLIAQSDAAELSRANAEIARLKRLIETLIKGEIIVGAMRALGCEAFEVVEKTVRLKNENARLRKLRDDLAILVDEHDDYADPRAKMRELGVILRWNVDDGGLMYTITDTNDRP